MCVDEDSDKKEDKGVDNDKEKEKEKDKEEDKGRYMRMHIRCFTSFCIQYFEAQELSVSDILNERLRWLQFPDSDCYVIVGSSMSTRLWSSTIWISRFNARNPDGWQHRKMETSMFTFLVYQQSEITWLGDWNPKNAQ